LDFGFLEFGFKVRLSPGCRLCELGAGIEACGLEAQPETGGSI